MAKLPLRDRQILFRAQIKVKRILPYIDSGHRVLDIGTGNGGVAHLLSKQHGITTIPVDIVDKSNFEEAKPVIINGQYLPFGKNTFHTSLLLTVLHHAKYPEKLVKEAARVTSDRIIIMEDTYSNLLQKMLTFFVDSVVNWEFASHPHNNRSDKQWRILFEKLGLEMENTTYHRIGLVFSQVTYVLKKKKGRP